MAAIPLPSRTNLIYAATAAAYDDASDTEEVKLVDWEAAKQRIVPRNDMGWIISNFVDLSPPEDLRANENGHIFTLADGEASYKMIRDTPLNWLHHEQIIVGHYVDTEILYHLDEAIAAAAQPPGAHIETLSTFYRQIYPRHWQRAKEAHEAGLLHASMEARPSAITCMTDGCCGETFPFITAWHDSYCKGLKVQDRKFIAHEPHWLGGACVVPPHRPGWKGATAIEVATYIEQNPREVEDLFTQIAAAHEGISDQDAELILAALLDAAGAGDGNGGRSRISMGGTAGDLHFQLPADLRLPTLDQVREIDRVAAARRTAILEAEANQHGVIVALVPPPEIAAALAGLGDEPADQIHVTLAFLGDSMGTDELPGPDGPVTIERLNAMVAVFAASEQPITARVSGLGRFDLGDGNEATWASVDAPGLNEFRARLVEYLTAGGVPVSTDHGFTPHATVQYHQTGDGPTELPPGLEWEVDSIELWWGSAFHQGHGLGGVTDPAQVAAMIAIDALADVDTTNDDTMSAVTRFVDAASVGTLQAVVDAGVLDEDTTVTVTGAIVDRKFTNQERADLAKKGQAMPDGSFPTPTRADWMNARAAIGRASPGDREKVISYLKRRAKALGIEDTELPESW